MSEKKVDYGPTAYGWGIAIGFAIAWFMCKYYPEDASWWQNLLLGLGIGIVILLIPTIWLPSPKKTTMNDEKEEPTIEKKTKNKKES